MAKATIEINDQFTFTWDKTIVGSEAQKRIIPEFVKEFFEKNIPTRYELPHVSTGSHSYKHSIGNTWVPHFNTKNIHMKCKYLTF